MNGGALDTETGVCMGKDATTMKAGVRGRPVSQCIVSKSLEARRRHETASPSQSTAGANSLNLIRPLVSRTISLVLQATQVVPLS